MVSKGRLQARRNEDGNAEVRTRLPPELVTMIDAWRARQEDKPSRSEALRRLLTNHFWPHVMGIEHTPEEGEP